MELRIPASREDLQSLKAGDEVFLTGTLYTARDAAHKRLVALLQEGQPLPFPIVNAAIYYAGPTPPPPGLAIGACGPTTSSRMDAYAPALLRAGETIMIGKGPRDPSVVQAMTAVGGVYLAATGGAGALLALSVKEVEVIAFEDLGTEAIRRLTVERFPCIVAIDANGNNLYDNAGNQDI